MKSNYKRLGNYIRQVDVRNRDLVVNKLLGLSIAKQFITSIANTTGTDMSTYNSPTSTVWLCSCNFSQWR